jgi:cyanophycinase
LLKASGGSSVCVLPTAAAYENPGKTLARAQGWFAALGATVQPLAVYRRPDALDAAAVGAARSATFIYLADGSAAHLRSVLKDTPLLDGIVAAWNAGAVLAASAQAATALCDVMVDARGGAFTVGLGVVTSLTVIPRYDDWSKEKVHRTVRMAPASLLVAGIDDRTALIDSGKGWTVEGAGTVSLFRNHQPVSLDALS